MQLLRDLKEYLIANGTTVPITLDAIGDEPDTAMVLYTYDSKLFGGQIAGSEEAVQIVVRSLVPTTAYDVALKALKSLKTEDEIVSLSTTREAKVEIQGLPIKIKTDETNRLYYAFNVYITSNIS